MKVSVRDLINLTISFFRFALPGETFVTDRPWSSASEPRSWVTMKARARFPRMLRHTQSLPKRTRTETSRHCCNLQHQTITTHKYFPVPRDFCALQAGRVSSSCPQYDSPISPSSILSTMTGHSRSLRMVLRKPLFKKTEARASLTHASPRATPPPLRATKCFSPKGQGTGHNLHNFLSHSLTSWRTA